MSNDRPHITVIGSRWLGAEVLAALTEAGYDTSLIAPAPGDRATTAARRLGRVVTVKPDRVPLQMQDFATRPDLIVCAHSFRILPPWAVAYARLGAIGYHPSLLPAFKGRHAVEDALRAGVRVTGGSVYWLTDQIDGGPVVVARGARLQRAVQVLPGEDAGTLWRRALAPLGRELLVGAMAALIPVR